jgi:uncharacterized sulfatase
MNNLANDPKHSDLVIDMRNKLWQTSVQIGDLGYIPEPLLEDSGKKYGNKYHVLATTENADLQSQCHKILEKCALRDIPGMLEGLYHTLPEVRFWAAYGLGNIDNYDQTILTALDHALTDESDAVRIAAARALCRSGKTEQALKILMDNLGNSNRITGMYAALFIEDLPFPLVTKAVPELRKALDSPYTFTQRIASRLLQKTE